MFAENDPNQPLTNETAGSLSLDAARLLADGLPHARLELLERLYSLCEALEALDDEHSNAWLSAMHDVYMAGHATNSPVEFVEAVAASGRQRASKAVAELEAIGPLGEVEREAAAANLGARARIAMGVVEALDAIDADAPAIDGAIGLAASFVVLSGWQPEAPDAYFRALAEQYEAQARELGGSVQHMLS